VSPRLGDLRDCFEGVIPSVVATLDADGAPNISYLSQVHFVDEDHVALSNQFFSKTTANVKATGQATVMIVSGRTGEQHILDLSYVGSLATGEVYDKMAVQLAAISSQHGLAAAMVLRSAELYRVMRLRPVEAPGAAAVPVTPRAPEGDRLALAARLAARVAGRSDAEAVLDAALDGLVEDLGFQAVMALALDPASGRLTTLASRGYASGGAGSEVALGDGAIGMAAASLRPVRFNDMSRGRRMAEAVRTPLDADAQRVIPLPGLERPESQVAAPMVSRGQAFGVLFAEAPERFRFTAEDEDALTLIGAQLAASLRLAELEAREPRPEPPPVGVAPDGPAFRVRYFTHDDSLFIDDAYVIKGVPGRLLFHFLQAYVDGGRQDFTNREIRLDASLRLPDLKDNLETRLILLRRRLDEKMAPVRLSRPGRGRIRLELNGAPRLDVAEAPSG
jgi:adenylate cyclase